MKPFWEGNIPLRLVRWKLVNHPPVVPSQVYSHSQDNWVKVKQKHPELYDGDILWLNKFQTDKDSFELTVSTIKFSQLLSLDSLKIDGFRGQFGFEALITNKNGKILFGERTHKSEYKPGYYQIPGGVFEK